MKITKSDIARWGEAYALTLAKNKLRRLEVAKRAKEVGVSLAAKEFGMSRQRVYVILRGFR